MPDYTNISWADFFSHIYIEKEALEYELTEHILAMYPDAVRIPVEHYKDIFNRPHQDCEIQKKAPSLVLAVNLFIPAQECARILTIIISITHHR